MWRVFTILGLALSIGVCTAFAQERQHKRQGPPKERPSVEDLFKARDKDHDGKISKDEFTANAKNDPDRAKELETRFKAIDASGDGYITLVEFKAFWEKHGPGPGRHHGKRPPQKEKSTTV